MCFYNDYDWTASVVEETTPIAEKPTRCDECGCPIQVGVQFHRIYQQEHEECWLCENGECSCVNWDDDDPDLDHACKCDPPNYGETYEYECCQSCWKFREAIRQHEKEEGCPPDAQEPSLCGIFDELCEFERPEITAYLSKAEAIFPELVASGYVAKARERLIGDDEGI